MPATRAPITVNGRTYRWMRQPLVVICVDGCEPDYVTQAMQAGRAPYLREMCEKGASFLADAVKWDIDAGQKVAEPFVYQAVSNSAADLQRCAETFTAARYPRAATAVWSGEFMTFRSAVSAGERNRMTAGTA